MSRLSTIELFKEDMHFSAGHFTVFSNIVRENLHGHNYNLYVSFTTEIGNEGFSFDYRFYKDKFYELCQGLNETVLLPAHCKHLSIAEKGNYYHVHFASEEIIFLKRDVKILPVSNITVEELSNWFLQKIIQNEQELKQNKIHAIKVKVFSGPGQSGSACWQQGV